MTTETPPPAEPPATPGVPATPEPPVAPEAPPIPTEPPAAAPKKRLSSLLAGVLGLVVGAGAVGGTWAVIANQEPPAPTTFTLTGAFALTDGATEDDEGCSGTGGYDDIAEGASVTVYNGAGEIAATGNLGTATYVAGICLFDVSIGDVPKGEKFYQVEVSRRGKIQLTAKEAESGDFSATLG
ncbi:hypothetical protein [Streptomyces sp. NPDC101178]|uniref:hypothetical protein n=1 Tax=Streptomyces sp. NPDC101178 TaxID=3366124 RepID=UPI0037F2024B